MKFIFDLEGRGRHTKKVYRCLECGEVFIKRVGLIADRTTTDIKAKGCTVPWGKSKTHKGGWEK